MVTLAGPGLEIDIENEDDPTYGDSADDQSHLSSLTPSVVNYKFEVGGPFLVVLAAHPSILNVHTQNGRRYHAFREGTYALPNDKEEQDRMALVHHIYSLLLGGSLYVAPLSNPARVLDLGTGTGLWAVDFADEHPDSEVIGTDLSAIQPSWVPPNVTFEIDDYETEWSYSAPFDLIHTRELMGFISDHDHFFAQAFENLNPGGWLEMQTGDPNIFSIDGGLERSKGLPEYIETLHAASAMFGKSMTEVGTWPSRMVEAGFQDVQVRILALPIGAWPKDPKLKEIGKFQQVQIVQAISSYTPALYTRVLGRSQEEVNTLCAKLRGELQHRSLHLYQKVHIVIGRKP